MTYDEFKGLFNQTTAQGNEAYCYALYTQAYLETGGFTSNIYNTCLNLFGMRPSSKRQKYYDDSYQTSGNGLFALYSSRLHSVLDRVDLDTYNNVNPPTSMEDIPNYYNVIKSKGYTHEANYVSTLVNLANSPEKLLNNNAFGDTSGDLLDDSPYDEDSAPWWKKFVPYAIGIAVIFVVYKYVLKKKLF